MMPMKKEMSQLAEETKRAVWNGKKVKQLIIEVIAVLLTIVVFGIPFYFVIINAVKNTQESSLLNMSWPSSFHLLENVRTVLTANDGMVVRAFINSTLLTVFSIIILVLVSSMAGFVLQRKINKLSSFFNFLVITGLIIPPAVVPTIWVLNSLGLFKTLPGIVLVEVALGFPFAALLYKSFMATIPREIDEAALIDGCGSFRLFFHIIFPLLKPVTSTIVILSAVGIYNDFVNPLYFYPGAENVTLQLTLYNFMSMYKTDWNLLFTNILLISLPPLILFIFFSKKIIAGMTAGSIK
ncbi:carbohydrate ABC transporter permease [Saccharococcus caldoxylosilyticus]|jgi:raffinose/stachyose/melibiose transport system permease protein|uniref:Putative ABC transporter permease protein n=2 Tax=Saccharococcus caldoxylosilyticus TaxID=81408 RepID=A0A023DD33_9BACL|nr:carbohydrate ABC transporter permease [Parageobacillus caldoxylosilyticus]MBB3852435.1 raffinose/stachyose/melibiose transport system permease protein [Parageobacillus caldoxylosilyticus]BDG35951.1 sugar ABC transporter permease [Parageobacillus caldoxylosilyticus]BDG39733.1 sugar ABC transporter permease [Parageobacillus caldoxylosilyticus]BDG43503.1 sugar ABC transporter permease [Parageobacillus caldoxylosilyticus]GAJ39220.1 putative ABC transporter permease protein [Parageobacillus cald